MNPTEFIWKNGDFIKWEDAQVHVLTHGLHYATSVFEGVRAYKTPEGSAIFRAKEHYDRLIASAKIYKMKLDYSSEEFIEATRELLNKNKLSDCYIRPLAFYGYKTMGLNPLPNPVNVIIAAWKWGTYLGEEGLEKGIKCKLSSWCRIDSRILPPLAKCAANYANSALAKMEALEAGYDEAILLNINGNISEGPGENIFVVKNGELITPPPSENALLGITSQSVMQIAKDLGIPVIQRPIIRDELFLADELFFTGTAAELTPIRQVEDIIIGSGSRGPVTEQLQKTYFDVVAGKNKNYAHWLTPV